MSTFLVIGGSSGIGKQLCLQLVEANHRVYATFHNHEQTSENNLLSYHYLNVLDETFDLNFLPEVLDGIVYCPGSLNLKPFIKFKSEDFKEDFNLQVVGAIKIVQSVLSKLKNSEHSSVLFFSTVAVQTGLNFHTLVSSTKGALEGLTRALAAELAPKIRVNCIAPSLTSTPLSAGLLNTSEKQNLNAQRHPLKKTGTPADIASMAEYLLSDKAKWITGQIIHVDGGLSSIR